MLIHRIWLLIKDQVAAKVISTSWLCNRGSLWRTLICRGDSLQMRVLHSEPLLHTRWLEPPPFSAWSSLCWMIVLEQTKLVDLQKLQRLCMVLRATDLKGFFMIWDPQWFDSLRHFLPRVMDITSLCASCLILLPKGIRGGQSFSHKESEEAKESNTLGQGVAFFCFFGFLVGEGKGEESWWQFYVRACSCTHPKSGEEVGEGAAGSVLCGEGFESTKWRTGICFDMTFQFQYSTGHMELQNWSLQDQFPFPSNSNFQGLTLRFSMLL